MPDQDPDEAVVTLITQHQTLLRTVIRSLAPRCPEQEDILQETNLVLWRKRNDFEVGTNFAAWASTVARFQVMAWQQRQGRRPTIAFDNVLLERIAQAAGEQLTHIPARREALTHCLPKLSPANRELIEHRYTRRAPLADFADAHGRSHAAVRKMLERTRHSLRLCINQHLKNAHS